MQLLQLLIISLGIFFLINFLTNKYNLLLDNKKSSFHKSFIDKNSTPPFTGGTFILFSLFFLLPNEEINFKIFIFLIYMSGLLSDIGILKSAKLRFIIQIALVLFAVTILNKYVQSVKWDFLDNLLMSSFFKILFTSFCILIVVNGTNFLDGLNTLVIGYYLLILVCICVLFKNNNFLLLEYQIITFFSVILFALLILNSLNLLYLGDNGAYLLAFFVSILLIDLSTILKNLSPYYIANLLWYPAYETLFSNLHLHQLIYQQIKKKLNLNPKIINTFSGIIINIFNLIIFVLATQNYTNSKFQIILLLLSVTMYNFIYIILVAEPKK